MRWALSLALVLSSATTVSRAAAQVVWRGDFETGDTSQFDSELNGEVGGVRYIVVGTDPVAEGTYAAQISLHDDARWSNGLRRVELHHSPGAARTAEGDELYFAWSFFLPETLPTDPGQTIGYWESNRSYQSLMAFELSGEDLLFTTRRPAYARQWDGAGAATTGEWHRIAMHILWSTDETVGRVDVWFDGEQVVDGAMAATLVDANDAFTQIGLLRGDMDFSDVPVIYLDDAVEGDTLADVRPDDLPGTTPPTDGGMPLGDGGSGRVDGGGMPGTDGGAVAPSDGGRAADAGATAADDSGCGCRVTARPNGGPVAWIGIAVVLALGARRRHARTPRRARAHERR